MEVETGREKSSSGEMFSFPSTPIGDQDSDFEFGSITPDSPSTFNNSPADHLFVNGRLLPHSFPLQPTTTCLYTIDISRPTSRTSSVGSKDSFMSSRSNSTNSRSSSSSSRTSSSDNASYSERSRSSLYHQKKGLKTRVSSQVYGSSKRWQFITSVPVPVPATLSRENSRRKKVEVVDGNKVELRRKKRRTATTTTTKKKKMKMKMWFGMRVFRWIILVCKECHAIEPSKKDDLLRKTKMESKLKPKPKPKPKPSSH